MEGNNFPDLASHALKFFDREWDIGDMAGSVGTEIVILKWEPDVELAVTLTGTFMLLLLDGMLLPEEKMSLLVN